MSESAVTETLAKPLIVAEKSPVQEVAPDYRQQRKIIKALLSPDLRISAEKNVEVGQDELDEVLHRMADGRAGTDQFKTVLASVDPLIQKTNGVYDTESIVPLVFSNEKMRAIVAGVSKGTMDSGLDLKAEDLHALLDQFPDPIELDNMYSQYADFIPPEDLRSFM